jgi:flagellar hook-associated protein 3 FlgL
MALAPFAPGGVQVRRTAEMFVQLRKQGVDLERQLTTGKKADSFGALGFARRISLDLRGKLSALDGYQANIKDADLRLKMMLQSTQSLQKIASDTRANALRPTSGIGGAAPLEQTEARGNLKLAIDLLNENINGRYLFSGLAHDQKPVVSYDRIMQDLPPLIAAEKLANDVGGSGTLTATPLGATASVTKGAAGGFGLVIGGAGSTSPSITAASPASFTVIAPPAPGATINLRLSLPDGSEETITLTAATPPAGPQGGQFAIDADNTVTAANISAALNVAIGERAAGALASASAVVATANYFADDTNWYRGHAAVVPDTARGSGPVRVDENQTIGAGAQANETGFRTLLIQLAALSAESFAPTDADRYEALLTRVAVNLSPTGTTRRAAACAWRGPWWFP